MSKVLLNFEQPLDEFWDNTSKLCSYDFDIDEIISYYITYVRLNGSIGRPMFIQVEDVSKDDIELLKEQCLTLFKRIDQMLIHFNINGEVIGIALNHLDEVLILEVV